MKFSFKLFLLFTFQHCQAGFPPMTDVNPRNVTVGQEIFIGFDPFQLPCLEALPNFQGLTEFVEINQNNQIEITISGLGTAPCLNLGLDNPPYQYYSLGVLAEGDYTVQMYWSDTSTPLPVPPNLNRLPLGENIAFGVFPPVSVISLNHWGIWLLFVSMIIGANLALKGRY